MPRLTQSCPICLKDLVLAYDLKLSDTQVLKSYKCGHAFTEDFEIKGNLNYDSVYGNKSARDYQKEGIDFIVNGYEGNEGGFNCIIGDQMRLGKTPQALLALSNAPERSPYLIIVKSANLWQWIREYKEWTSSLPLGIFPIIGTKTFIPPGFNAYIISMDTFSRPGMADKLLTFGFKVCVVDEMHSFKNTKSNRSQALVAFLKNINTSSITHEVPFTCMICKHSWTEEVTIVIKGESNTQSVNKSSFCPKCYTNVHQSAKAHVKVTRNCGVILLSGTSIKNRASEYFVPLNIVAPDKFPSLESFKRQFLTLDGKRVMPHKWESFRNAIRPYVLRREKEDVYKDLPPMNRMFTLIEMESKALKDLYNAKLDEMEAKANSRDNFTYFDNIGDLMVLRHICGLAKVKAATEYIEEGCADSDNDKFAVGIHHKAVRDSLYDNLSHLGAFKLSGEDNAFRKDEIMRQFETSDKRVLIINMLAGGVGMDFHYCHNVLILERQFSSADEEQFEFRFYNPDKGIMGNHTTNIEYLLAKGTIDEWWHDMVEEKRAIFGETISNNWSLANDTTSFKKLLDTTLANRV